MLPVTSVRTPHAASPVRAVGASPPASPQVRRPVVKAVATGPADVGARTVGTAVGLAAGVGGAWVLHISLSWGMGVGPLGWAAIAGSVLLGGALGYFGGDRIGDWIEKTPSAGPRYVAAQVLGATGGALLAGLGGHFLAFAMAGGVVTPLSLLVGGTLAVLGGIGGAEGARRAVSWLAAH